MTLPLFTDATDAPKEAILFCDGASLGNPGKAGIGVVLVIGERRICLSESIGITTNNSAEYRALIRGVEEALLRHVSSLRIHSDSELLVRQIKGEYKTRQPSLVPLNEKARCLLASLQSFSIEHIPREENREADRLAKKAASQK